jgi:FAD/FMN-containing dehydrogenase
MLNDSSETATSRANETPEAAMAESATSRPETASSLFEAEAIERFADHLRGTCLRPGDGGYDEARTIWNATIDKRPALIARCAGAADVIKAVKFARDRGLLLSVRGGGHNVAGNAVCDGGMMIDLSPMKSVRVDPRAQTARAEPGVTWAEFDAETQEFGLATTGGVVPTTGIAGLTLGGGLGWLMGKHGLAADNLLSADLVTAEGKLVTASARENEDLFWGLRGGGGNFGVVTSFEFQLHRVGEILGGMVLHAIDDAPDVIAFVANFAREAPDELVLMIVLVTGPDGSRVCGVAVCYNGDHTEGGQLLRPLRDFGKPVADQIGPMSYRALQNMFLDGFPAGRQNYWKSNFLRELNRDAIDVIVESFKRVPSPTSAIAIECLTGAVQRVGSSETAFSHRNSPFNLLIVGIWPDPADTDAHVGWVRKLWQEMQPYSSGVYVNYLGQEEEEGRERIRAAYDPAVYGRLADLKRKYDPNNLFRMNQNIAPASSPFTFTAGVH